MPISAVDIISPAFQHTKLQLLKPFRAGQWVRLALLGIATGELGSSGSCRFNVPSIPQRQPSSENLAAALPHMPPSLSHLSIGQLILIASFAVLLFAIVMLLFIYLNSICRFILFDSILKHECKLREGWRQWRQVGRRFFVWQLLFQIVVLMGFVILIGLPLGFAYLAGWFIRPKEHLAPLILGGILFFFVMAAFTLCVLLVHVTAKDFVVPLMALDQLDWRDACERCLAMLKTEKGGYAAYFGMKALLAIAASLVLGVIGFIIAFIFILPVVLAFLIPTVRGGHGGVIWNVYTITVAVVVGIVLIVFLLCLISLISVPVVVFFPAYAIYFFAARYPALSLRLYGPPPPPPTLPLPQPLPT